AAELVRHVPRERVRTGRVQEHLDEILEHAEGVPLLLFLDPYGMTLDARTIAERLLRRGRGPARVPTEVLVNFATHTVRREGGHMNSESPTPAAPSIIEGMNQFLDGTWWQGLWGKSPEADRAIAEGWGERIEGRAPGFKAFSMGVPRRWEGDPLYYLTLVTEHPQGGWFFADSLRGSVKDFYRFDVGDRPQLFDPDYRGAEAVEVIAANLRRLVDERGTVRLGHVTRELYGEVLGFAGAKEVKKAVKLLHHRRLVDHDGVGELHDAVVGPGDSMSLI
ncbi:MAG: three-Cys-motif partner protein TcmP, partial [Acidimicrobiia bacterium]